MKLTRSDLQKVHTKQVANILNKLNAGKTITAREERMLAQAEAGVSALDPSNFCGNLDAIATRIGRSRRCLNYWREKFKDAPDLPKPRANGDWLLKDWLVFMKNHELQNAPDIEEDEEESKAYWARRRERVEYEKAVFSFEVQKGKYLETAEITGAIGQMLAGFRTALNMLPGSAARWLQGLKDFHAIKNKLQSEVDAVLQALGRCRYLEQLAPTVIAEMFKDREQAFRDDLVRACEAAFGELGRQALSELVQREVQRGESVQADTAEKTIPAPEATTESDTAPKKSRARSRPRKT